MKQEVTNFARFYALLAKLPGADKETLVYQFTGGRTSHLHLMTADEYRRMLRMMDGIVRPDRRERLRRRRSMCLHLLQKIGVDTSDWARVNAYCMNPRIAGRPFSELSAEGLSELSVKLRMILKKQVQPKSSRASGNVVSTTGSITCVAEC